MKNLSFKRIMAMFLTLAIVVSFVPMTTVSATGTDSSSITVSGDTVTLTLEYANTYYDRQTTGYDDASDIRGATLNLINTALDTYNTENGASLAIADIDNLKVKTAADVRLTYRFSEILKAKLPQLVEIDMSESAVTQNCYSWDNAIDNWFREDYFAGMNSLKKVSLPAGAVILRYQALANLKNLEEVVLGDAVEEFGYSLFYGDSKLTKLDIPASLCKLSSVGQFFDASGIKEFSFHGTAENATDKAAFFNTLTTAMNRVNFTKLDLSNSGIDETNALTLANKSTLTYLDLTGCTNIDFTTTNGQTLKTKLQTLKANGVTVKMPVEEEEPEQPEPEEPDPEVPDNGDRSSIEVSGETVTLNLLYANTYWDTYAGADGYNIANDIRGATLNLINEALNTYNTENDPDLTMGQITNLVVKTAEGVKITYRFNEILNAKLPQLVVVDMSEATVTNKCYSDSESEKENMIRASYFKNLTSLKKVVLPAGLVELGSTNFQGIKTLEEVVFGDALNAMGYGIFENCSALTKIDLPDSLNSISSILYNFSGSGIKEFSYHGAGEGAADTTAFFTNLVDNFNQASYTKMDLSGSAIDAANVLKIANKSTLTYLDLTGCENIDFNTADGINLEAKLEELKAKGVTVLMPVEEPDNGDRSSITVSGDTVTLNLLFANTYWDTYAGADGYNVATDIRGATLNLIDKALNTYNILNSADLTMEQITNLVVKTAEGVKITYRFNEILNAKLPQLVVVDMSEATVTNKCYSDSESEKDNMIRASYFKNLTSLKKVVLPAGLVELGSTNFQGIKTLEEVVFGDALQVMGYGIFENCSSLTKIDLPDSLNSISSILYNFSGSGIKEFSYHGAGEGAADVAAFFTNLVDNFNQAGYTKMDLSGSAIDAANVLKIANKSTLTYLDLTGCENIDLTTADGQTLKAKIAELKANGVTVKLPIDTSFISVSGNTVTLTLDFENTYYDTQSTGYDNPSDIRGATLNLINEALSNYNNKNSADLTMDQITNLVVKTAEGDKLTYYFQDILKEKLPQLVEIDMSKASVSGQVRSWDAAGTYQDNWMRDNYFVGLSNLKKVALPAGLVTMRFEVFSNLKNLEEVVFGDALQEMGYGVFYGCSKLTKIDIPDTLCIFSSYATQFEASGIKEFSFHGAGPNTDKAAFFTNLVNGFNKVNYSKIDLSGSAIDETNALTLVNANKTNLTYLDLSDCENIDLTTADGKALKTKIAELKANGVIVKFPADTSFIIVSGSTITLTLDFAKTYYDTQSTGYDNPSDIRGATLNLINEALNTYNTGNDPDLTMGQITNLVVRTADDARLTYYFQDILKAKLPQLVEIDMSGAALSGQVRSWDAAGTYQDNWMRENYFVGLSNLKKVVLPAGLVTMRFEAFSNLKNLEEVVFGNALQEIGYGAFYGCSKLTKIDLPDSLCVFSSIGTQFEASGIKEISFHGKAENSADKLDLFSNLVTAINKIKNAKLDFSGSGFDENTLLPLVQKAPFIYLDIRNCPIDYTTPRGQVLKNKLNKYKSENPEVTILWDNGIVRDKSYTAVSAVITLNEGETMAEALADWEAATGVLATTITDLVIKTEGSRELAAADYTKLQEVMLSSLRKVDLTGAALKNDAIPANAFKNATNLLEIKFPAVLKEIGDSAFYATDITSLALPEGLKVIGARAFDRCFSLSGELILPNGLVSLGDRAFADAGITKLEYHGPVDVKLITNFTYSISTLKHLDLRGCTAVTQSNFPISNNVSWDALEELNLDFCSIETPYQFFFYWVKTFSSRPTITANCQFKSYDSVEEMLAYPIYGTQYEDYKDFDGSVIVYDHGVYELQDIEENTGASIPVPGSGNWSGNTNAYNVKISNESIGNFQYYGWYITNYEARYYDRLTEEQQELYNQYVFDREGVNCVPLMVNADFYYQNKEMGTYYSSFESNWKVGTGGLIDEIAERNLPVFATLDAVPLWMRGDGPYLLEEGMVEDFAKATVNMVCDLVEKAGLNVVYVSIGDEPDGGDAAGAITSVDHYSIVLPVLRQYLNERGLNDVGIFGPETCNFSTPWFTKMRSMDSAWSNLDAVSGHGFGFGIMSEAAMYQSRAYNMPIFITSTGFSQGGTFAGDYLETTDTGEDTIADYFSAIRNVVGLIHDVNLGANAYASWGPSAMISDTNTLNSFETNWSHVYMNPDASAISNGVAKSATFDYFSAALDTVQPGAKIYYASTEDTDMTNQKYTEDTKLAVNAGINPDGTWGINILNKTDSDILAPHSNNNDYEATPAKAENDMVIDLDIVGLYGTGEKQFKMYSTRPPKTPDTKQGSYYEDLGTVTLVDGRGWVEVDSLELISLQSVESIPLNNKPLPLKEEIKDLNIASAGYDYMFKNGSKTKLNVTPEQVYDTEFRNSGIKFEASTFAQLIGGTYSGIKESGILFWKYKYVTITKGSYKITIKEGETTVECSGAKSATLTLNSAPEIIDGKMYFAIPDSEAQTIADVFGIGYNQYISSGIIVVGDTDVVNVSRFTTSSLSETLSNEFAGSNNCTAEIKVDGDTTELVLDLGYTYYENTSNNIIDSSFTSLMNGALDLYNLNKDTALTAGNINKLTISTKSGCYLTPVYAAFVKAKLPHLVELDLSNAAFNGRLYSSDSDNANVIPSPDSVGYSYSLSGEGTTAIMPNLKKLSLPKGITTISDNAFRNLTALEYLVLPDNVSIGQNSFAGCNNLKTIVANNVVSAKDGWNGDVESVESIIYTGTQLNFYDESAGVQTLPGSPTLYYADVTAYAGVNEANKTAFNRSVYLEDSALAVNSNNSVELSNGDKLFGGYTLIEGEENAYTVKWNAPELLKKWVQHKETDGGNYILRFVSTIDALDYTNVGFAVSLSNSNPSVGDSTCISDTSSKVYETLCSGEEQVTTEQQGAHESANYFFAYQLSGVPADFDGEIYIRPFYTTVDDTLVYGTASTVTLAAVIG